MIRDVKEIEESTLWEDTGRQIANKNNKSAGEEELKRIVFIVGEKSSGKSSFLKIIKNDFDPETKPNSLIEYIPAKIGREKKYLIHFYQIGSIHLLPILESFSTKKKVSITVLICVDLSKGRVLVPSTLQVLKQIKATVKNKPSIDSQFRQNHEDAELILQMPFNLGIVGCKWDLFQKLDLETKKWVSRSVRYLAHTHSASVMTSSNKNNTLGLNLRSAFTEFFLSEPSSTSKNMKDVNKPLFIKFGQDKISDMNLPTSGSMTNIEVLQKQLQSVGGKDEKKEEKKNDIQQSGQGKLEEILRSKRKELARFMRAGIQSGPSRESIDLV